MFKVKMILYRWRKNNKKQIIVYEQSVINVKMDVS